MSIERRLKYLMRRGDIYTHECMYVHIHSHTCTHALGTTCENLKHVDWAQVQVLDEQRRNETCAEDHDEHRNLRVKIQYVCVLVGMCVSKNETCAEDHDEHRNLRVKIQYVCMYVCMYVDHVSTSTRMYKY